jgi:hypothetical protein
MRTLAALLLASVLTFTAPTVHGAEPWLKAGDVVALVGGEDMVALAEEGWLETLVTWAQPKDRIRWRSLAWEGDTVFEQRRDLNYPTLEAQLDKMGATVVLCQFGKMESFAGKEGVAAFTEAYEKLLARLSGEKEWRLVWDGKFDPTERHIIFDLGFGRPVEWAWLSAGFALTLHGGGHTVHEQDLLSGGRKRRIALVLPPRFGPPRNAPSNVPDLTFRNADLAPYHDAIRSLASKHGTAVLDPEYAYFPIGLPYLTRDGVHHSPSLQSCIAEGLTRDLWVPGAPDFPSALAGVSQMRPVVVAKNRLWFHYTRPQNWAFLAGNRTNQPSSRDHLDPTKRWFPEEMEQWLPLIEAKEKEIWKLAVAPR